MSFTVEGPVAIMWGNVDPMIIKQSMIMLEEDHLLGRYVDIDVIDAYGYLKRTAFDRPFRTCFVCDEIAHVCVRNQTHDIKVIQDHFVQGVLSYIDTPSKMVAFCAMAELATHPGFGKVTPVSTGIHQDMDVRTFIDSIYAISPMFDQIEQLDRDQDSEMYFNQLRQLGLAMENQMFLTTEGINTHKGFIFLMLMVLGAAHYRPYDPLQQTIRTLAKPLTMDFQDTTISTTGLRWYHSHQMAGIRGLALDGLDIVFDEFLPYFIQTLESEADINDAFVSTLLLIMSRIEDTTILKRQGLDGLAWLQKQAKKALQDKSQWKALDKACHKQGFSPGGSADVLAVVVLLACFFYDSKEGFYGHQQTFPGRDVRKQ